MSRIVCCRRQIARAAGEQRQAAAPAAPAAPPETGRLIRAAASSIASGRPSTGGRSRPPPAASRRSRRSRADRPRALDEEPDRPGAPLPFGRGRKLERQRTGPQTRALLSPGADPAGDQHLQLGADVQELATCGAARPPARSCPAPAAAADPQNAAEAACQRLSAHVAHPKRTGDGRRDEVGSEIGARSTKTTPSAKSSGTRRRRDHQARLADAARTRQRQQADTGVAQQRGNGGQFLVPGDQERQRPRKRSPVSARDKTGRWDDLRHGVGRGRRLGREHLGLALIRRRLHLNPSMAEQFCPCEGTLELPTDRSPTRQVVAG